MQKPATFSVIIPTLNEERFVGNLLASLVAQKRDDFEVIVVDGKSKDKTLDIIGRYRRKLSRLVTVQSKKTHLAHQWNLGIKKARGKWFVFVHADGVLMPYFFDRITTFIEQERPEFFTSWFRPDSEVSNDALITLLTNLGLEMSVMIHRTVAPGSLTVVSRHACLSVGGFNEEYWFGEDADFGSRLAEAGYPLQLLRETLVIHSLRRFRKEGTLRVLRTYARAVITMILTRRPPKIIPGYVMGGALYAKAKSRSLSLLRKYERQTRQLLKEFFS